MIAVLDQQFRLLTDITKVISESNALTNYSVYDKLIHSYGGKEYKYEITDIVHNTNAKSTQIVVKKLDTLWGKN